MLNRRRGAAGVRQRGVGRRLLVVAGLGDDALLRQPEAEASAALLNGVGDRGVSLFALPRVLGSLRVFSRGGGVRKMALHQGSRRPNASALLCVIIACAIVLGCSNGVFARDGDKNGDDDDGDAKTNSVWPTTYLDMRTSYATVPAGSLPIGFGNTALGSALESLALSTGNGLPASPTSLVLASRQGVAIDFPLTVDVTDHVSLYAGVSGTATNTSGVGWSSFDITSWNVGLQADVYEQKGGQIPTITWQSTYTQSIPNNSLGSTNFKNILEFGYALDKDETRGLLAGVQDTRVELGTTLARIHPSDIFYIGGYYQWPSNWKFTGRFGVQYFGGAELLRFTPIQSFTQPVLRLDLDRMDDNDNRLFGVTAEIMWVPKPAYLLTLRTPLYLVRN